MLHQSYTLGLTSTSGVKKTEKKDNTTMWVDSRWLYHIA